jgi:mono/diheme cytochrome c family protein
MLTSAVALHAGAWMGGASGLHAAEPGDAQTFDQVLPILASHCAKCHGDTDPKGGLRLNSREGAIGPLESGHRAVVPGDLDQSELWRRVTASDPEKRMPRGGKPLTNHQVSQLRNWIEAGAPWPEHWAYRPLQKSSPPTVAVADGGDWIRTPIDAFILDRLRREKLSPSPEADKRSLIRRLHFDLTGLPPSPEQVAAFVADVSPDAYEQVVDRLLSSPHYGERWARHWMDVVHFAETHGHDQDRPREHAWWYRDYLIRAFNQDKPYDRFVTEQIAGDEAFPNDPWAVVATGLLAAGSWDESSLRDIREDTIDREIARYLDRDDIVTTVMATFTSTSVHCARCHEHKFDPISQEEYYGLQAVFAGVDKANRPFDPDPQVATRRREFLDAKALLPERLAKRDPALLSVGLQNEVAAWEARQVAKEKRWSVLDVRQAHSAGGASFEKLADGSWLATGKRPDKDVYTVSVELDIPEVTAILLEVLPDDNLPTKGPGRADNGNLHLNAFKVSVASPEDPTALRSLELVDPVADFNQTAWEIDKSIDGDPNTAWGIHPEVGKKHQALYRLKTALVQAVGRRLKLELHQIHGGSHLIGRFRLRATSEPAPDLTDIEPPPVEIAAILKTPAPQRTEDQQLTLAVYYSRERIDADLAALPDQAWVYCGTNQFQPDGSFKPSPMPRPVQVLYRGDIKQPRQDATPGGLRCVESLPAKFALEDPSHEGARRRSLAEWITAPQNGLAWRSIVNRVWQNHFGRGLVNTPNDFGRMGARPSHPELLDWLADHFQREGGSLKALHRLIVTSAVYRQSSQHRPDGAGADADNRWLWRMNRRRLDAESIRDAVLLAAGTLDTTMGGASVKQFIQTKGAHVTPNVDYVNFDVDDQANHRRSVYRFLFRTMPDPFMDALDCPDAAQLAPKRTESYTALQALAMLHDRVLIRQCERLADRAAGVSTDLSGQIDFVFNWVLARSPTPKEVAAIEGYVAKHGLANACRYLVNSNEFMFVE